MRAANAVLVLNAGSSSLKYKLFRSDAELLAGHLDGIGKAGISTIRIRGTATTTTRTTKDHEEAIAFALSVVATQLPHEHITYVLHRVVHGGERFLHHTVITTGVEKDIEALATLAPLHNPANLAGIRAARRALPNAMHIAFFDTAFHHTIPKYAFLYGIPYALYEKWGIRKYGFHGLSHEYCAEKAYELTKRTDALVTCHLGAGSSIAAIHHGRSVDTTMGFTPLDGLLMGTRSGEIDPDIPLFLIDHEHLTTAQVSDILNKDSGLKGITGTSDLREIKALADKGDVNARIAIEMLCYRIALAIGSYHVTVGGIRTLTFTGGIGENAPWVRSKVCAMLAPLGVLLDTDANARGASIISSPASRVNVLVIPADEELQMIRLFLAGSFIRPDTV